MNIFSVACVLLLSDNANVVLGSSIRGIGLELEWEKKESTRNLSESGIFGGSEGDIEIENVPDDLANQNNELDGEEEPEEVDDIEESLIAGESSKDDNGGPDGNDNRLRGYSYHGGNPYQDGYSGSYGGGNSYNGRYSDSSYHKRWNKGCRTYHGGRGSSDYEYDLYNDVDKHFCERKCDSLGHYCYGYEYSNTGGRCEVWKVPIQYVEYSYGYDCYKK